MIQVVTIRKIYSNNFYNNSQQGRNLHPDKTSYVGDAREFKLLNIREIVIFKEDLILPKLKHTGLYFVVTTSNNPRYKLITILLDFHISFIIKSLMFLQQDSTLFVIISRTRNTRAYAENTWSYYNILFIINHYKTIKLWNSLQQDYLLAQVLHVQLFLIYLKIRI